VQNPVLDEETREAKERSVEGQKRKNRFFLFQFKWLVRIASVAAFLIAWQIVGAQLNPILISTPTTVFESFIGLIEGGQFPAALAETLETFAVGYLLGCGLGIFVGAIMARSKVVENALDPYINALFATPFVALIPLFITWFGIGYTTRVVVVILSVVFVMIINSLAGFRDVSKSVVEMGRSFGLSGLPLYRKIVVPASIPYIVAGLRLAVGRGLVGIIIAEIFLQMVGIGYLLEVFADDVFQVGNLLAITIVIGVIGVCLTEALKYVEKKVAIWRMTATLG